MAKGTRSRCWSRARAPSIKLSLAPLSSNAGKIRCPIRNWRWSNVVWAKQHYWFWTGDSPTQRASFAHDTCRERGHKGEGVGGNNPSHREGNGAPLKAEDTVSKTQRISSRNGACVTARCRDPKSQQKTRCREASTTWHSENNNLVHFITPKWHEGGGDTLAGDAKTEQ